MMVFCSALLFLSAVITTANAESCPQLSKTIKEKLPVLENEHKHMNLTLDCGAVNEADRAVELLLEGKPPTNLDNSWCQYYRTGFDFLALAEMLEYEPCTLEMPWGKIYGTAVLHPKTTYGCACRSYEAFMGYYYTTVCIYKRKVGENRCFCY
ncbi:hypothetical protein Q1695_015911 [Nippostrongylus brasiliensis]|nr:hypothetical protein Q1695_015911 [Nippostrongylus brasiliensis]